MAYIEKVDEIDITPEWKTFWVFIETQIKKHDPKCYKNFQNNIEIIKLNTMAKKHKWEVTIGLR